MADSDLDRWRGAISGRGSMHHPLVTTELQQTFYLTIPSAAVSVEGATSVVTSADSGPAPLHAPGRGARGEGRGDGRGGRWPLISVPAPAVRLRLIIPSLFTR